MSEPEYPTADGVSPPEAASEKPQVFNLPVFEAEDHARWKKPNSRGCLAFGIVAGIILLSMILWAAYFSLEQSVWATYQQTSEHLVKSMTFEIDSRRRVMAHEKLKLFTAHLKTLPEPYPPIGRFNKAASHALRDGRLSRRELDQILTIIDDVLASPTPEQP